MAPGLESSLIDQTAATLDDALIALRRDIHRWPELAGQERRTAALVADRLRAADLTVTTGVGGHGVVAVLDGAHDGPTVAYRADMDAVDDHERYESDFASQVQGAGHLCGHDLHTVIGLGIAQVLGQHRQRLRGRVVFLFQPAEETLEGARAMIADDVLVKTAPQEIYALHCGPSSVGTLAIMPGVGLPGQDHYRIALSGPTAAADADRLTAMIDAWSTVAVPRTPEELTELIGNLRQPDGPLARFVFIRTAQQLVDRGAEVQVWLRAWPDNRYPELREGVRQLVASVGGRIDFPAPPFPAMVCSPELSEAAGAYLRGTMGAAAVTVLHAAFPFNGEDFALFLRQVPGAMFVLGVANPAAGINGVPHTPHFAADERAIGVGVRAMAGFLTSRLDALTA